MSRLRNSFILGGFTLLLAIVAAVAVLDPFNLRYDQWFVGVSVLLAVVLATFTILALIPVRMLRIFVGVLGFVVAGAWVVAAVFLIRWAGDTTDVSEPVVEGDRALVVVQGGFIDPEYGVVLRSGSGILEQESLVWQGLPEGTPPTEVSFTAPDQVQVLAGGCTYVSLIEPMTLEADPMHVQMSMGSC